MTDTEITTTTDAEGREMTSIRRGASTMTLLAENVSTHAEFLATARDRFGDDPAAWAFGCPNCGDIATGADFGDAARVALGQECIGRSVEGRGCDWTANGLFSGPCAVTFPDGRVTFTFRLAARGAVSTPMLAKRKPAGAR